MSAWPALATEIVTEKVYRYGLKSTGEFRHDEGFAMAKIKYSLDRVCSSHTKMGNGVSWRTLIVHSIGTIFPPELIDLMKTVLEDSIATLPEAKQTSAIKAEIASKILESAAMGERNPAMLKLAALSAVEHRTPNSHSISSERRMV